MDSGGSRQAEVFDQTRQFSIATRLTAKEERRTPHTENITKWNLAHVS